MVCQGTDRALEDYGASGSLGSETHKRRKSSWYKMSSVARTSGVDHVMYEVTTHDHLSHVFDSESSSIAIKYINSTYKYKLLLGDAMSAAL